MDRTRYQNPEFYHPTPERMVLLFPHVSDWNTFRAWQEGQYIEALCASREVLETAGISTALRLAHFLGQCLIESNFFRATEENLNYSAHGLRVTWPARFPTGELAAEYARQPERIANYVYADRMENGDEASGDGWRYRGRGIIQLTGRQNYRIFGDLLGLPLEDDPDILARDFRAALHVAAKFFSENNLLALADADDAKKISRAINRGNPNSHYPAHKEADRIRLSRRALSLLSAPT